MATDTSVEFVDSATQSHSINLLSCLGKQSKCTDTHASPDRSIRIGTRLEPFSAKLRDLSQKGAGMEGAQRVKCQTGLQSSSAVSILQGPENEAIELWMYL